MERFREKGNRLAARIWYNMNGEGMGEECSCQHAHRPHSRLLDGLMSCLAAVACGLIIFTSLAIAASMFLAEGAITALSAICMRFSERRGP